MARAVNPDAPSGAPVPKMSPDAQRFVVRQYARFRKPSEILALLKDEFPDLEVSINAISYYNPERDIFPREKWGEFYETERRAYIAGVESVGIAHARERLRYLDDGIRAAAKAGNYALVRELAETAAKERGGAFLNRRELTGADGAPLIPQQPRGVQITILGGESAVVDKLPEE